MQKVCIVGLGQIGFQSRNTLLKKAYRFGLRHQPKSCERFANTKVKATTNWESIPSADVYIISVTTGKLDGAPDLSAVFEVSKKIAASAKPLALVAIESTIVPGTSRKILQEIFQDKIQLVHAPHRYWADEPITHGVNQLRVIGGVDQASLDAGMKFYKEVLGISMHVCSSIEVAEMCKIVENSHRYLQIAFAEDLKMLCNKIGMNFDDLRAAANTKWNVDIPEARDGIGRHCLPKDIRYVTSLAHSTLLDSAMKVDVQYREWLAKQKKP
jgi:UDP-N-acetyl-D-mannosaminuronic acid dehydrogenase